MHAFVVHKPLTSNFTAAYTLTVPVPSADKGGGKG